MAGDVNKSVEITLRANLKQLQSSLAQIPGMTKKEAGQMTRALAAEFQKATKAANKAAAASEKAAKATAKEYKKSSEKISESFKAQAQAAKRASEKIESSFMNAGVSMKSTRKQSRDLGAALGSLEDVIGGINPELAILASEIGTAGQAARSLSRSLATGNPILMGVVAVLAALAVGYTAITMKSNAAKKAFEDFTAKAKDSSREVNILAREIEDLSKTLDKGLGDPETARLDALIEERKLQRELGLLQGDYTQAEKELSDIQDRAFFQQLKISDESEKLRDLAEERKKKAEERIELLDTERRELFNIRNSLELNTKERAEATKLLNETNREYFDLIDLVGNTRSILRDINEEESIRKKQIQDNAKIEENIAKAREKQKQIDEARARAEKNRVDFMTSIAELNTKINTLEAESVSLSDSLLSKEEQIKKNAQNRRDNLDGQLQSMIAQVEQLEMSAKSEEQVLFAEEARLDLERASEAVKKSKAAITEQEKRDLEELNKKTEELVKKQEKLSQIAALRVTLEEAALDAYLDTLPASQQLEAQEIRLALAKQDTIDKINEATEASLASAETQEERDMIAADRKKAMFAAEAGYIMELDKLREDAYQKQLQQTFEGTKVFLSGISSITTASLEMMEKSGNKNKKLVTALFLANKTAALGEIVMNTAKSITAAGAQFGPLAPLAIAGYVATAAAQSAIVMSQQPPKFHMGGMIEKTPDERVVVVKQGEAILDRATVNSLGDQGVSRLQNGQGMSPEVIVMNPYKHFDRFMQDRARSGLSSSRSARRGY
jgi:hypothetical protein